MGCLVSGMLAGLAAAVLAGYREEKIPESNLTRPEQSFISSILMTL